MSDQDICVGGNCKHGVPVGVQCIECEAEIPTKHLPIEIDSQEIPQVHKLENTNFHLSVALDEAKQANSAANALIGQMAEEAKAERARAESAEAKLKEVQAALLASTELLREVRTGEDFECVCWQRAEDNEKLL